MAGHYNLPLYLNAEVIDILANFTNTQNIGEMEPFKRYTYKDKSFMRLTDRFEPLDTDVITISPTTLFDSEGEIDTICIAEIHLNRDFINKIYCVL